MFSELNHEASLLDQSIIGNNFYSVKQLLNQDQMLMSPLACLPQKFKGMILLETFKQKNPNQKVRHKYFIKWYLRTSNKLSNTISKILTSGSISLQTFFYRIKVFSSKTQKIRRNRFVSIRLSDSLDKQKPFKHQKKGSILKSQSKVCSNKSTSNIPPIPHTFSNINNYQNHIQQGSTSKKIVVIQSLKQLITQKIYKSNRSIPQSVKMISNKFIQEDEDVYLNKGNQSLSSIEISRHKIPQTINFVNIFKGLYLLANFIRRRLFNEFNSLKQHNNQQLDYESQLIIAKRNLQLAQLNFQIQNQIKQINDNHYEQLEYLQKLTVNFENFKMNNDYSRTIVLLNCLKHFIFPKMRYFYQNLRFMFQDEIMSERNKDLYIVEQLGSYGSHSRGYTQRKIQYKQITSLNEITEQQLQNL